LHYSCRKWTLPSSQTSATLPEKWPAAFGLMLTVVLFQGVRNDDPATGLFQQNLTMIEQPGHPAGE